MLGCGSVMLASETADGSYSGAAGSAVAAGASVAPSANAASATGISREREEATRGGGWGGRSSIHPIDPTARGLSPLLSHHDRQAVGERGPGRQGDAPRAH